MPDLLPTNAKPVLESSRGRIPIDPDCLLWVTPLGLIAAAGFAAWVTWIWLPALLAAVAVLAFFRDPPRTVPSEAGAVVSPADGKVVGVDENADPTRGPAPGIRISIFLSVLDCHINRSPVAGVVERIRYERGGYLDARKPESSESNECNWIFLRSGKRAVTVRQIAGLVARRIVCRVRENQSLARGQRIGLIRFGSRTEVYLPPDAEVRVRIGDKVYGASTILATLREEDAEG